MGKYMHPIDQQAKDKARAKRAIAERERLAAIPKATVTLGNANPDNALYAKAPGGINPLWPKKPGELRG